MTAGPLVEIEDLAFERPRAAGGFELRVPRLTLKAGQRLAFVGPSGCGKSTLLDLLGLILRPSSVTRFLFRPGGNAVVDLAPVSPHGDLDRFATLRRTSIGYVLQQGALLPFLSVFDNIRLGNGALGRSAVQRLARHLEIEHLLNQRPRRLSAGERQRVAQIFVEAEHPFASSIVIV